jgi:hypothetical protein
LLVFLEGVIVNITPPWIRAPLGKRPLNCLSYCKYIHSEAASMVPEGRAQKLRTENLFEGERRSTTTFHLFSSGEYFCNANKDALLPETNYLILSLKKKSE